MPQQNYQPPYDYNEAYTTYDTLYREIPQKRGQAPVQNWNATDFRRYTDATLGILRDMINDEQWDKLDRMKPRHMRRDEFAMGVLREAGRRNMLNDYYAPTADDNVQINRPGFAITPYGGQSSGQYTFNGPVSEAAQYEASRQTVVTNKPGFDPYLKGRSNTRTDASEVDFGYTVGANPRFNPNSPHVQVPMSVEFGATPEQVQSGYCPTVKNIYQPGRQYDPRDAFLTGFVQGRVDAGQGFPVQNEVGLFGPCPPAPAPTPSSREIAGRNGSNTRR